MVGSISEHSNHYLVQNSKAFGHVSLVREGGPPSSNQIPWHGVTYVLWALTNHFKGRWGSIGKRVVADVKRGKHSLILLSQNNHFWNKIWH